MKLKPEKNQGLNGIVITFHSHKMLPTDREDEIIRTSYVI